MVPIGGKANAYVCMNFVCQLPTTDVSQLLANLQVKRKQLRHRDREDPKERASFFSTRTLPDRLSASR